MPRKSIAFFIFAVIIFIARFAASSYADDVAEERLWISLDIFPRIVAVDMNLAKKVPQGSPLKLLLLYQSKKDLAVRAQKYLQKKITNISGFPVEISVSQQPNCADYGAIMVTEKLDDVMFNKALSCAVDKGIILFSPNEEDVPRGATASVLIKIKVEPYFNKTTLAKSHLMINQMVLKFSNVYE